MRQHFIKTQRKVWVGILLALAACSGIAGTVQLVDHHSTQNKTVKARHAQHFYAMVAGRIPADGPTVDVSLANDLKELLGPHDSRPLPQSVDNFRGTSSSYGGIGDVIGFEPFDNAGLGCTECGPLTLDVTATLQQIKRNQTGNLFKPIHGNTTTGYTLTPFAIPSIAWLIIIWLAGGPFSVYIASVVITPEELPDRPTTAMWLLAPTYWLVWEIRNGQTERGTERRLRAAFPEQMACIDDVDRLLTHTSGPKARELQKLRDQVIGQLQSQTASGASPADDIQLQHSMRQLTEAQQFLNARAEATRELTQSENQ